MTKKYTQAHVFIASLAIISIVILPVIISNGGNLYLVGDYMSQQIPFIKEMRRLFLSGAPFWSSNTFLGSNFLGTYSFYNFFSPFYLPLFLIPEKFIGIGLAFTFALKHTVSALSAHLYLKNHVKISHFAFIGALIYAFSGFVIDSTYYFHFLDVIAVFPLILYLTDEVLDGRKKCLLSLAVLLNAMINYYFLVATSVFFLTYLFFRVKFSDKKYTLNDAARCIVFYAVGGFCSMFVLIPSALSLLETNKATGSFFSSIIRGFGTVPQLLKVVKGLVLPSEGILGSAYGFEFSNFNSNSAFLPFFGALLFFIALRKKDKSWYCKLFKFIFILTIVPFGNGLFSFFTNMSYTRWYYAFTLIATLVSIKILEEKPEPWEIRKSAKSIFIISSFVILIPVLLKIIFAYLFPNALEILPSAAVNYLINAGLTEKFDYDDLRYFAVFAVMTAVTYLPLYFSLKKNWIYNAGKAVTAVILICIFSYTPYLLNEANIFGEAQAYIGNDPSISQNTSYSYRTDFQNSFANYPATVNSPGIGAFISFKSHATAKFCNLVGYDNTLHLNSSKHFDTEAIQSVLSVKNVVSKNGKVRKADYYTPFGFSYDYYVLDDGIEYTTDKSENNKRIEMMTKAAFVDSETAKKIEHVAKPLESINFDWKSELKTSGCENFEMSSHGFTAENKCQKDTLTFFSIPHDNGWKAYINGEETEILTLNGGLMGIITPKGENRIEFVFTTPGLKIGSIISIFSLLGLGIYSLSKRKNKKVLK